MRKMLLAILADNYHYRTGDTLVLVRAGCVYPRFEGSYRLWRERSHCET